MQKGRRVSNRVDGLVHKLDTIQNEALRNALPVYRTFPTAALQREAAVLPLHIALDHRAALAAAQIKRLDNRHPLVQRVKRKWSSNTETRLLQLAARAGPTEPHDPLARSPWELRIDGDDTRIGYIQGLTANEAAVGFRKWVATISQQDIIVYSDGSQLAEGSRATGAGWVVSQGPGHNIIARGRLSLHRAEVFDAEAVAALQGLREALTSVRAEFTDNLYICLDNLEVARSLTFHTVTSSQQIFAAFAEAAQQWPQRTRRPHTNPGCVMIRWVPGHSGVLGNEAADREAKTAATEAAAAEAAGELEAVVATLAYTKRYAKEEASTTFQAYWKDAAPDRYKQLGLSALRKPPELNLSRFTLGKLYASRSGHGDFAEYHERFKHVDAERMCQCGHNKTPEHFFFCRLGRRAARQPWAPFGVKEVLTTQGGTKKLNQWLAETGYFRGVCPPYPQLQTRSRSANGGGTQDGDA
jgi:ribonuclease HI